LDGKVVTALRKILVLVILATMATALPLATGTDVTASKDSTVHTAKWTSMSATRIHVSMGDALTNQGLTCVNVTRGSLVSTARTAFIPAALHLAKMVVPVLNWITIIIFVVVLKALKVPIVKST